MFIDAKESHDLRSASWKTRKACSIDFGHSPKASSNVLFYSGLPLIGYCLSTLGSIICFTQPTDSSVNHIQRHPPKHTQNSV